MSTLNLRKEEEEREKTICHLLLSQSIGLLSIDCNYLSCTQGV